MGKHARHRQTVAGKYALDLRYVFAVNAQPVHARVQCDLHLHPLSRRIQRRRMARVHHRLRQPMSRQQRRIGRVGVAEDQHLPANAAPPQAQCLLQRGHGKAGDAHAIQRPRHRQIAVAICVGLHHCHQLTRIGQPSPEKAQVVCQRVHVQFDPRPTPRRSHSVFRNYPQILPFLFPIQSGSAASMTDSAATARKCVSPFSMNSASR